jgi:hypothetical protein
MDLLYRVEAAGEQSSFVIRTIESPGYLDDKEAGSRREFDILVTGQIGRVPFGLAIECKDWEARVDVPVVEGFIAKCAGTNIPLRMIVSSSGFTAPALAKADFNGVQCRTLSEVSDLDWLALDEFTRSNLKPIHYHILADVGRAVPPEDVVRVIDRMGREVDPPARLALANAALAHIPTEMRRTAGEHEFRVAFEGTGWSVELLNAPHLAVARVVVTARFVVEVETVRAEKYLQEVHGSHGTAGVVVGRFPEGNLVIAEQPDGSKSIVLVRV